MQKYNICLASSLSRLLLVSVSTIPIEGLWLPIQLPAYLLYMSWFLAMSTLEVILITCLLGNLSSTRICARDETALRAQNSKDRPFTC